MTEDEAKQKWCPFIRRVTDTGRGFVAANQDGFATIGNCIGSQCMMWNWDYPKGDKTRNPDGCCGLAGK